MSNNTILYAPYRLCCNGIVVGNAITRARCRVHMKRIIINAENAALEIVHEAVERVRAALSSARPKMLLSAIV